MKQRILGRTHLSVSVLGLGGHTYPVGDGGFCSYEDRAKWEREQLEQLAQHAESEAIRERAVALMR